jgi:hypothetical protein
LEATVMRIAAPIALFVAAAGLPPAAYAQLSLQPYGGDFRLDHDVPVATVSLVGDIVTLGSARTVTDSYGAPFVLGAATLDRHDPAAPRIVFTMANTSGAPIRLSDVVIYERTMLAAQRFRDVTVGAPYMPSSAAGWFAANPGSTDELPPGEQLTVRVPISPTNCTGASCDADGFVVFVGRTVPKGDRSADPSGRAWIGDARPAHWDPAVPEGRAWLGQNPIFTRAFLARLSAPDRF